jgi:phosphohistidine phosphatase SixA
VSATASITTRARAWPRMCGRMRRSALGLLAASALLAGCVSSLAGHERATAAGPTFLLVRHAEKSTDDPRDPSLTPAGEARAQRLAAELRDAPLVAVYSTDTRRTRATATPAAQMHGLTVAPYDARTADAFASELRARHRGGLVLVVGHSNTVPALAAALCGCAVAPMTEQDYGLRYRLHAADVESPARLEAEAW